MAFAHGGASAHAPANSLDAFRLALRLGATGLHSDVWLSADGVPVFDHDGRVRIGLRRRPIAELDRAEVASLPSLADLYEELGTEYELSLDVKDPAAVDAVVALGRAAGSEAVERLWLCHSDLEVLTGWRDRFVDVRLVDRARLRNLRHGPERRAAQLSATGIDAINMHHSDWTGGLTTLFHRFGRLAFAWDAQHERILKNLMRMGVDGVYSDHVDRMVDVVS